MFVDGTHYFGMHLFWWFFWVLAIGSFFSLLTPVPRQRANHLKETPLDTLLRRLTRGEINEQEYDRLKAVIDRDTRQDSAPQKLGVIGGGASKPLAT